MNQRFIPRSAKLDSFTMQPFFVILEGSYSLGSILSVAVGWEARVDPDPIQSTISFQSSLLENVQAALPAPPRLRPFFGETMKYDHSSGFSWNPAKKRPKLEKRSSSSSSTKEFARRSLMLDGQQQDSDRCLIENEETGQCSISHADVMQEAQSEEQARQMTDLLLAENEREVDENSNKQHHTDAAGRNPEIVAGVTGLQQDESEEENSAELEATLAAEQAQRANLLALNAHQEMVNQLESSETVSQPSVNRHIKPIVHQRPYGWPLARPNVPMTHDEFLMAHENRITAKFHNIDHLHHLDNDLEDSIIINQIVVNPLQANYGKGNRPSKVFCPAHPGRSLKRDQTIRLQPNLLGRCQVHHHG